MNEKEDDKEIDLVPGWEWLLIKNQSSIRENNSDEFKFWWDILLSQTKLNPENINKIIRKYEQDCCENKIQKNYINQFIIPTLNGIFFHLLGENEKKIYKRKKLCPLTPSITANATKEIKEQLKDYSLKQMLEEIEVYGKYKSPQKNKKNISNLKFKNRSIFEKILEKKYLFFAKYYFFGITEFDLNKFGLDIDLNEFGIDTKVDLKNEIGPNKLHTFDYFCSQQKDENIGYYLEILKNYAKNYLKIN